MQKDPLGDRLKQYESRHDERALARVPIVIRLDGRNFSAWTKGLERPFDPRFSDLMVRLTRELVLETRANVGYTQSDEITLVLVPKPFTERQNKNGSQLYFDSRFSKIISVTASFAGAFFNREVTKYLPEKVWKLAMFDCRAFEVPNEQEAANCVLWREIDATKNSVQGLARKVCSHTEMHGKTREWMLDQIQRRGKNWHDMPPAFTRGTYVRRLTQEKTPGVIRPLVEPEYLPPATTIENLVDVLFHRATPVLRGSAPVETAG